MHASFLRHCLSKNVLIITLHFSVFYLSFIHLFFPCLETCRIFSLCLYSKIPCSYALLGIYMYCLEHIKALSSWRLRSLGTIFKISSLISFLFPSLLFFLPAAAAKSLQSCPTLCDPIDGSPPGPAVPGILQARTLEWVAISSSNA